jgi:small nuclear ribonucleoprotein (snRNP)-like protein
MSATNASGELGVSSAGSAATISTKSEAEHYLHSLINKTLRIYTTDARLFVGTFKCTDPVGSAPWDSDTRAVIDKCLQNSNIVLSLTHEYRQPSQQKLVEAAGKASTSETFRAEMTSRYLGLIVVPGEHIVKIEVEEFVSQMKSRSVLERRDIYASR